MAEKHADPGGYGGDPEGRTAHVRHVRGDLALSSSSHFPLMLNSKFMNPVHCRPASARLSTKPVATGSERGREHDRHRAGHCSNGARVEVPCTRMTFGRERGQFPPRALRMSSALAVAQRVSNRTLRPTWSSPIVPALAGRSRPGLKFRIVRGSRQQHADAGASARPAAHARRNGHAARRASETRVRTRVAACPPPSSGGSILAAKASKLIEAETRHGRLCGKARSTVRRWFGIVERSEIK